MIKTNGKNYQFFTDPDYVTTSDVEALIPEEQVSEIIQGTVEKSAVLSMGKRLQDMSSTTKKIAVLDTLPLAYFVSNGGLKGTTKQAWDGKEIVAEEIAVIVPIKENDLEDASFDLWGQIKPRLQEAFAAKIDAAIFAGTDKPASWPKAIIGGASDASAVITATGDTFQDVMGEGGIIAKVEESGYFVTGHLGNIKLRSKLRGLVDENRQPIFASSMQAGGGYMLDGAPITFDRLSILGNYLDVCGDFSQLVYAIRKDLTFKIFTEGVISDADGKVIYNLMQNDMCALRAVMRLGWQLPNPVNHVKGENRYPFSVLAPANP